MDNIKAQREPKLRKDVFYTWDKPSSSVRVTLHLVCADQLLQSFFNKQGEGTISVLQL